jgi:opacity protein-like surface antigen
MKFVKFILSFCLLTVAPAYAGQYIALGGGTDNLELTNASNSGLKVGFIGSARYGYLLQDYSARAEVEVSYRRSHFGTKYKVDNLDDKILSKEYHHFHSWSYMVNLHYDITSISVAGFVPSIGAGIGFCQNTEFRKMKRDFGTSSGNLRDNRLAYQGIIGLKYPINESYHTSLEYHYFCGKEHAKSHSVNLLIAKSF